MVILILGRTLVFWSGILLGISLFSMLLTCRLTSRFLQINNKIHKYFVVSTIILAMIHMILGILSSLGIWL